MPNYKIIDGALQMAARAGAAGPAGTAAQGRRIALVAARFNADIVDRMVQGATAAWLRQGGDPAQLLLVRAPGAFELPLLARKLASTGRYDAIVALGCVIRGDTAHFDFVAGEAARGIAEAARDTGVPVIFGVLTTESLEQALERASPERMDKGGEALDAALEMALVLRQIDLP
jgi:6,7-dimethyl-8-ribityllumazine synthase